MKHRNGSRFISAKANRRPRPGAFVAATIAIAFASVVAMAGPASATSTPGSLSFIAGDAVNFFAGDPTAGPALNTPLYKPEGIAFDSSGDLYIADFYASAIEKVTPSGTLSIFAGIPGNSGYPTPGPATSAQFERPNGIAVDPSGNVYVADESANVVVMITPTGTLSIVAGTAGQSGNPTPGPAASSLLNEPDGLSFDAAGNLYIADRGNSVVEKVTPTGTLSIFAGVINHYGTPTAGPATSSYLNSPYDITFDKAGDAYISDQLNNVIEKVTPQGTLSVIAGIVGSSAAPTAGPAPR